MLIQFGTRKLIFSHVEDALMHPRYMGVWVGLRVWFASRNAFKVTWHFLQQNLHNSSFYFASINDPCQYLHICSPMFTHFPPLRCTSNLLFFVVVWAACYLFASGERDVVVTCQWFGGSESNSIHRAWTLTMCAFKFGRVGGFSREPAAYQNDKSPKNPGWTRLIGCFRK